MPTSRGGAGGSGGRRSYKPDLPLATRPEIESADLVEPSGAESTEPVMPSRRPHSLGRGSWWKRSVDDLVRIPEAKPGECGGS
jgi:hypothetical protein